MKEIQFHLVELLVGFHIWWNICNSTWFVQLIFNIISRTNPTFHFNYFTWKYSKNIINVFQEYAINIAAYITKSDSPFKNIPTVLSYLKNALEITH